MFLSVTIRLTSSSAESRVVESELRNFPEDGSRIIKQPKNFFYRSTTMLKILFFSQICCFRICKFIYSGQ